MKKLILSAIFATTLASGANATQLDVKVDGIDDGSPIPEKFAHCVAKGAEGKNISPKITWSKGPDGTQSYAIIVVDRDVPVDFSNANKDGKTIDAEAPRQNFYHWMLINIPVNITSIAEDAGKSKAYGDQLVNDFLKSSGLPANGENTKKFTGYDGPCPPWNDERLHYYHYKVYALSQTFNAGEGVDYTGDQIIRTITPYILGEGEVVGSYTLNPKLAPVSSTNATPKK